MPGKLITIEGTDGTGKATQSALLVKRLQEEGHQTLLVAFPRYGEPSAYFVERYLKGHAGDEVTPHQAALFYALDRFEATIEIRDALKNSVNVIADRYTASSLAHLGGQIATPEGRQKFQDWLLDLEYRLLNIPEPDQIVLLHLPIKEAEKLLQSRQVRMNLERDIHEANDSHLQKAETAFLELSRKNPELFKVIEASDSGEVLAPEIVHEQVWQVVSQLLAG